MKKLLHKTSIILTANYVCFKWCIVYVWVKVSVGTGWYIICAVKHSTVWSWEEGERRYETEEYFRRRKRYGAG